MSNRLNAQPTEADRAVYKAEVAASKLCTPMTPEWAAHQFAARDALVSCYGSTEPGRSYTEHEVRSDGSCRCGKLAGKFRSGQSAFLIRPGSREEVVVDENHGDGTVTVRFLNSETLVTVRGTELARN